MGQVTWHSKVDESQMGCRQACWWLGLHNTFCVGESGGGGGGGGDGDGEGNDRGAWECSCTLQLALMASCSGLSLTRPE